jgi:hypothetical protein
MAGEDTTGGGISSSRSEKDSAAEQAGSPPITPSGLGPAKNTAVISDELDVPEGPDRDRPGEPRGSRALDGAAFSCCPERDLAQHAPSRCWPDAGAPEGRCGAFKEGALRGPARPQSVHANTQRQGTVVFGIQVQAFSNPR